MALDHPARCSPSEMEMVRPRHDGEISTTVCDDTAETHPHSCWAVVS